MFESIPVHFYVEGELIDQVFVLQLLRHWHAREQGTCDETISFGWKGCQFFDRWVVSCFFKVAYRIVRWFIPGSAILKSTQDKSWRQSTGCRDRRDLGDESDPSQKSDAQREEVWVGFWIIFVWFSFVQDSFCFWDGKEPRWSSGYPTGCFGWIGTGRSLFLSSQCLSVISSCHLSKWQFYS